MHSGGLDDDQKDSAATHITLRPQLGGHRQCGLAICTFHLGFSLVASAGLLLPATFAKHLGLLELADHLLDLGGAPGRANTGDKMLTLVTSALAGGDCVGDALRAGGTVGVLS